MIAACCGREAATYRVVHQVARDQYVESTETYCHHCRRQYGVTDKGPKWIRSSQFCADGECREPIFRFVTSPANGMPIPLWPNPDHLVAEYECRGMKGEDMRSGPDKKRRRPHPVTWQHYCGPDCAPDVGATPHHRMEEGGDPHRYRIGKAIRVTKAATWEFCQQQFTDARGNFWRAWFADHLHLPRDEQDRLMRLWEDDRGRATIHGR